MSCRQIFDRFIQLFPWYKDIVESYKLNKVDRDSIVIRLKDHRTLIFKATSNLDSLSVLH